MSKTTLNMQLLLRRAEFAASCVLAAGEPGYHTSTKEFKIGDGSTTWENLPIANKSQIDSLISGAISAHAAGYYTKGEVDGFVSTINEAVNKKLDAETYNTYVNAHASDYTNDDIDEAIKEVDDKFASYTTTTAQEAIDAEQDRRLGVIEADYLKTADKTELQGKIDLKANASDVALMYTNDQIDGFLGGKVDKTTYEGDKATFALKSEITTLSDKADKSYVDEELAKKVNVASYKEDKATFALKADLEEFEEGQDVINEDFEGRIADLEAIDHDKLAADASAAAVATILDGAPEKFDTLKEVADWISNNETAASAADLVTRVAALEAIDHEAYVDADAELKEELEGKINDIHSHTNLDELNKIADGDVAKWNAEIGAKELAASKTTTAEVKTQIEAYVYAKDVDAQKYASDAQAAAEAVATGYNTAMDARVKELENNKAGYATTAQVATAKQEAIDAAAGDATTKANAAESNANDYADGQIASFKTVTVDPIAARVKAIEDAPYATTGNVATAKQEAIDAAKLYADGLSHKDTTYTVAATTNALEFTVTPSEGSAQTVKLVAPVVDTGIMEVAAGTDVVVTPGDAGKVTVAHAAYQTGTIKAAEGTEEPNFLTSVTIKNGHVESATVQTLKAALESMSFILDGGTSAE